LVWENGGTAEYLRSGRFAVDRVAAFEPGVLLFF